MPDPNLRAADTDRQTVADALGRHLSDGRLTLAEYEERLAKAWEAKTYGDLAALTTDLPSTPATSGPVSMTKGNSASGSSTPAACGPWGRGPIRAIWASWLTTALIVTTIWLITSVGNGRFEYFWPIWVIGPWGAVLLARTLTGQPAHRHDRRNRRLPR